MRVLGETASPSSGIAEDQLRGEHGISGGEKREWVIGRGVLM